MTLKIGDRVKVVAGKFCDVREFHNKRAKIIGWNNTWQGFDLLFENLEDEEKNRYYFTQNQLVKLNRMVLKEKDLGGE